MNREAIAASVVIAATIIPRVALPQPANCSGSACNSITIFPEQPGIQPGAYGVGLTNNSNAPVSGSISLLFAGCLGPTGYSVPPHGHVHWGNPGYCTVTANLQASHSSQRSDSQHQLSQPRQNSQPSAIAASAAPSQSSTHLPPDVLPTMASQSMTTSPSTSTTIRDDSSSSSR